MSYCKGCGAGLRIVKRTPMYNDTTGKVEGYYLTLICSKKKLARTFGNLWGHWGRYQEIEFLK